MKKICSIVASGPSEPFIAENSYIIAADGGLTKLDKLGIKPDLIIGDFDSCTKPEENENVKVFPIEKDDTDTILAIKEAANSGFDTLFISGCMGGLIDHTLANIQSLLYAKKHGLNAFMIGEGFCLHIISDGQALTFKSGTRGRLSLFAVKGEAVGVNIKGAKYNAENIKVTPDFPIGVSNSFTEKSAEISVKKGYLLICFQGTPYDITEAENG